MSRKDTKEKWKNIKVDQETLQELVRFRAWLELSTGRRFSLNATIKEMAGKLNQAVTIPWPEAKK
jgi:hypothetical protein